MNRYFFIFILLLFPLAFLSWKATAQETSADLRGGSTIIGYDNRACNAGLAGSMRFNSATPCVEFCNSTTWACTGGACTAPSGCTNVGDVCADGSQFAGFMVYNNATCEALFVTDDNQSSSSKWKTSTGVNDISPDSHEDGRANQVQVVPPTDGTFPAFDLCENLNRHGKTDWYLPAQAELNVVYANRAAIDAAPPVGAFTTDFYWSSSEENTTSAFRESFTNGVQSFTTKTTNFDVRCIRRN